MKLVVWFDLMRHKPWCSCLRWMMQDLVGVARQPNSNVVAWRGCAAFSFDVLGAHFASSLMMDRVRIMIPPIAETRPHA
jgi:hypothetical protein